MQYSNSLTSEWLEEVLEYLRYKRVAVGDVYAGVAAAFHALGDSRQAMRFYEEALKLEQEAGLLHDFACLLIQIEGLKYAEQALRARYNTSYMSISSNV